MTIEPTSTQLYTPAQTPSKPHPDRAVLAVSRIDLKLVTGSTVVDDARRARRAVSLGQCLLPVPFSIRPLPSVGTGSERECTT